MIKLVIFDFDGVFTNGHIYYSSDGKQLKYYNVKDGLAVKLLQKNNIKVGLISLHKSEATSHIVKHLSFDYGYIGPSHDSKLETLKHIMDLYKQQHGEIYMDEIAYMGDDLADKDCMKSVGLSWCPKDAVTEIQYISKHISSKKGGKGCVREFVEYIINHNNFNHKH